MPDIYLTYLRLTHIHRKTLEPASHCQWSSAGMYRSALFHNLIDWGF